MIPLYTRKEVPMKMKKKLYYLLAAVAIVAGITTSTDVRQSPPDPTCPFDPWPCTAAGKARK